MKARPSTRLCPGLLRACSGLSAWAVMGMIGCTPQGNFGPNRAPETAFSVEKIELTGENRLNSRVELSWYGTDVDGYVAGFEISTDSLNWNFTERNDSVFRFSLPPGSDTADIDLWLRSIDDQGLADPSPARLRIPLKNSPPEVAFDTKSLPSDSVLAVFTFRWTASDPDGDNSLEKAFLKANTGPWIEIDKNQALISLVLDTAQPGKAYVYYGTRRSPEAFQIDGMVPGGENRLYLKTTDLAGAQSLPDSTDAVVVRPKTADLLVVGAQPASVTSVYLGVLQSINVDYDLLDCFVNSSSQAPRLWDPSFDLILGLYNKAFVYSDATTLPPNPVSGAEQPLLPLIAPSIQRFTDRGGRSLTTTSFAANSDLTSLTGPFPFDGLVVSVGQARIAPDSGMYALDTTRYPDVRPTFFDFGVDPLIRSVDSEDFYRGRLTKLSGWTGDNLMGSLRRNGAGQPQQVFFSVELHKYNADLPALEALFDLILNEDFDGN
ncbi:hypothetical protein GC167_00090 [bacterium]|nr:hypothetical protein [bacterium]